VIDEAGQLELTWLPAEVSTIAHHETDETA
jgi:hypothetical protein